jgi:hypothetical protein
VLLVTVLWTAFLTFRDLYLEKQQLLKKKQAPGLSVSSNHVPVTASAPAPNASKIFINATPDYLMDLVEGKLSTEAERMIEPYIGKWMTVTDRISDVSIRNTGSIVTERNDRYRQLDLWFNSAWNERLNVLYKGQEIRVNGKIDRIWPTRIFLIDCELTN